MSLPVELLQRRAAADRYDAAVVGAGIAGLVCAAVLGRGGARVALIDVARRPGGRVQTIAHQGYAVDLAPLPWEATGVRDALAAAGVRDLMLADLSMRSALRLGVVEAAALRGEALSLPVPGAVPSPAVLDAVRLLYGVPPRVFAVLGTLYDEIAGASQEQLDTWRDVTLGEFIAERRLEPVVAAAVRRSALLLGAVDVEEARLVALATHARLLSADRPSHLVPADNPVAGGRGVVQALVDAFVEAGGELRLGTRAVGLAIDGTRLRGLAVQREEHPFLDELVADRVVLAIPEAAIEALLPPSLGQAEGLRTAPARRSAVLGMAWAFQAAPEEASGASESAASVLRLVSPVTAAGAAPPPGVLPTPVTLTWSTAHAPRIAPPGQTLLLGHATLGGALASDQGEIARQVALVRAALRDLFPSLDKRVVWERHWLRRDASADPFAPGRLPPTLAGCEELFLAGEGVATAGAWASGVAAAAISGRAIAERILSPAARAGSSA